MILAGVAGYVAYRLFKVESERDQRAEQARRQQMADQARDQAARIGFWKDNRSDVIKVLNASSLPVYDAELHVDVFTDGAFVRQPIKYLAAIVPGEQIELSPQEFAEAKALLVGDADAFNGPHLYFRDNAGLFWERMMSGELRQWTAEGRW